MALPWLLVQIGGITGTATTSRVVGWVGKFRHTAEELERKLKAQRANTFSRRWFEEFLDAQDAALKKAGETKSEKQKEALLDAVAAIQELADTEEFQNAAEENAKTLSRLLRAAANASRVTASLHRTRDILEYAAAYDDDEEAIELLLLH